MYSIMYYIFRLLIYCTMYYYYQYLNFRKKFDIDIVEEAFYRQNYVSGSCTPSYIILATLICFSVCISIYLVKLISEIYYK